MTQDMISSSFRTREAAEDAVRRLENIGVVDQQISIIAKKETRDGMLPPHGHTNVTGEASAAGATAGGLVGAVLGALASAAVITVPGLNIVVVGTMATVLAGLGTGAITGGIVGALIGAGISPDDAKVYERELNEGAVLLTVRPLNSEQRQKIHNVLGETEARHLAA